MSGITGIRIGRTTVTVGVFLCSVWAVLAQGEVRGPEAVAAALKSELNKVRLELDTAKVDLQQANTAVVRYRHDICYTNAALAALNKEILQMEKTLVEKRRELDAQVRKFPEMKKLNTAHDEAYKRVTALHKEEARLLEKMRDRGIPVE